jgi:uncharacterized membrane protein (DUF373 family)
LSATELDRAVAPTATLAAEALPASQDQPEAEGRREARNSVWTRALEWIDSLVYVLVGVSFCVAALFSLANAVVSFLGPIVGQLSAGQGIAGGTIFSKGTASDDIITLVSDLLLTLIIMEVLGTVVHHLRDKETTLRPFLFIGIISATRGILAVGARLSVSMESGINQAFQANMIELGVNAVVIIALGVAMKLIGGYMDEGATPSGPRRARREQRRGAADGAPAPRR